MKWDILTNTQIILKKQLSTNLLAKAFLETNIQYQSGLYIQNWTTGTEDFLSGLSNQDIGRSFNELARDQRMRSPLIPRKEVPVCPLPAPNLDYFQLYDYSLIPAQLLNSFSILKPI